MESGSAKAISSWPTDKGPDSAFELAGDAFHDVQAIEGRNKAGSGKRSSDDSALE
jgi:hypothetical protein